MLFFYLMDIYLSHSSSLAFWSSFEISSGALARCRDSRSPSWRKDEPLPSECKVTELLIRELARMPELEGIALPLHVIVPSQAARSRCGKVACHVSSATFPRGSFIRIARNVLASSPELCFVQMASELSLPALIRLGFELCGTYGVATVGKADFRFERPFTTPARLARFLDKAANMPGTVKARKALKHLVAGSASPMETTLAMLLCLPLRMGGYALPQPRMNHAVNPRGRSRLAVDDKCYYCDLIWPNANIALEYDGREHHGTVNKMADDATRRNNLLDRGVSVLTVTTRTVRNLIELDHIARTLSRQLGFRPRCDQQAWRTKQHELHGELLGSSFMTVAM